MDEFSGPTATDLDSEAIRLLAGQSAALGVHEAIRPGGLAGTDPKNATG